MGFAECLFSINGEKLARLNESTCKGVGLHLKLCRAQGYSDASSTSGECKGTACFLH